MDTLTPQRALDLAVYHGTYWWAIRPCSLCGHTLSYQRVGAELFFDPNCDCVTYTTRPEPCEWDDFVKWIEDINAVDTFIATGEVA